VACVAALLLMVTGVAWGGVVATVTSPHDPTAVKSCPGTDTLPCTVVSRTTAIQEVVGNARLPMRIAHSGRIVGWQITLSSPTVSQIRYFDAHEGGTSKAALAVLRHVRGLDYRLVGMSPLLHLQPHFGQRATFALPRSIPVEAGDVIALTVPTWVPALELQAGHRTAWRASRPSSACSDVAAPTAQVRPGSVSTYSCIYQTALVTFGAIVIWTP
jgi:hypothetical protein